MDELTNSSGEHSAGNPQPRPSVYDRLMPLMYALIGAAATMFLNVLICGRPPRCPPARACAESVHGARARGKATPPENSRIAALVSPPARPVAPPAPDAALPAPDAAPPTPDTGAPARAPDARSVAVDAAAPAGTVEARLATAIRPCVRGAARSFLLAVRLQPDGQVSRVFVARDPGVNAAMTACITKKLGGMSLPLKLSYSEWRVRQAEGGLSLKLVRHQP